MIYISWNITVLKALEGLYRLSSPRYCTLQPGHPAPLSILRQIHLLVSAMEVRCGQSRFLTFDLLNKSAIIKKRPSAKHERGKYNNLRLPQIASCVCQSTMVKTTATSSYIQFYQDSSGETHCLCLLRVHVIRKNSYILYHTQHSFSELVCWQVCLWFI